MFGQTPKTASEWVVRMNSGRWSEEDAAELQRWLEADPARGQEIALAEAAWRMSRGLERSAWARRELDALHREARKLPFGSKALTRVAGALAAAVAGAYLLHGWNADAPGAPILRNGSAVATAIGEIKSYGLPDGSTVTLNADSMIQVAFTGGTRDVKIERGEAFFDVQHDAAHPFVVVAGSRRVTVTGTKFNVDYDADGKDLEVAVVQGSVKVANRGEAAVEPITAGDVFLFPEGRAPLKRRTSATQVAAWQARRLYFDDASLHEVATEVNRFSRKPVVVQGIAEKHALSGSFRAGDIDAVLFSLKTLYDLDVRDTGDAWVLAEKPAR